MIHFTLRVLETSCLVGCLHSEVYSPGGILSLDPFLLMGRGSHESSTVPTTFPNGPGNSTGFPSSSPGLFAREDLEAVALSLGPGQDWPFRQNSRHFGSAGASLESRLARLGRTAKTRATPVLGWLCNVCPQDQDRVLCVR